MARTTKVVGFTVPFSMAEEFDRLAQEEQRTKSELFREMFRVYRSYRHEVAQADKKRVKHLAKEAVREEPEHLTSDT